MAALAYLFWLISLVCWVIILIDAFKNEIWKGIVGFICGLYLLYYAFAEFQHPNKVLIIVGWLLSGAIGYGVFAAGALSTIGHH